MTCGGSHLGFPIGIKNRGSSNDHSWAVWFQLSKWFQRRSVLKHFSHRVTLDPMGKMFQNASSLKPLGQLKSNCPGMIIGRSSVFYADRKSKMAATTGHSINTGPYRENTHTYGKEWTDFQSRFSQTNVILTEDQRLSRACIVHLVIIKTIGPM
jgi:hypothetical protein